MPKCVALGCSFVSKSNQKGEISLHSFPSDEPRRTEWQKACGRTQLPIDPRLCSQHFLNDAFEFCSRPRLLNKLKQRNSGFKSKLKPSAIPTIFYHESAKSLKQTRARACRKKLETLDAPQLGCKQPTTASECGTLDTEDNHNSPVYFALPSVSDQFLQLKT